TARMRIVNRGAADGEAARRGVDDGVRLYLPGFERRGDGERLERGPWLVDVGQRTIAHALPVQSRLGIVRIECRRVGDGQDLSALRIENDHATRFRLVRFHRRLQL